MFFWQPPVGWVMGCSYMFHWRCWGRKHKKTWQTWKRKHLETWKFSVALEVGSWIWGQAETRYQHFTQFQRICQCSDALPGDLNPKTVGMESNRLPWNHPWKWYLIMKVLQVQQYQTWREKNVLVYWFDTQSTGRNLRTRWEVMSLVSPVTRFRRCHFVWAADLAQC